MLRQALLGIACGAALQAGTLPAWWEAFPKVPSLESPFVQESDSAVFGKLRREGTLKLAQGGRLRVEYHKGLLLVSDGRTLVQYDPEARTAQRLDLRTAAGNAPMLNILLNPRTLADAFKVSPGPSPEAVTLVARHANVPTVIVEGQGRLLKRIQWTDATGARQVIELKAPKVPATLEPGTFTFKAPPGIHWLGNL